MIQVLIDDPQSLAHHVLCSLLSRSADIAVVSRAQDLTLRTDAAGRQEINVVVLDPSGIARARPAIHALCRSHPEVRTLLLADSEEASAAMDMFRAGFDGYLTWRDDAGSLLAAIRRLGSGCRYICPEVGWGVAVRLLARVGPAAAAAPR